MNRENPDNKSITTSKSRTVKNQIAELKKMIDRLLSDDEYMEYSRCGICKSRMQVPSSFIEHLVKDNVKKIHGIKMCRTCSKMYNAKNQYEQVAMIQLANSEIPITDETIKQYVDSHEKEIRKFIVSEAL